MAGLLNRYKTYPDINTVRKTFLKQDNSDTLVKPYTRALQQVAEPYSRKSLFNYEEKYSFFSEYKCSVVVAWKRGYPIFLTLPFRMDWPYGDLFNFAILRSINHGFLKMFQEKYYGGNFVTCPSNFKGTPLGLFKLLGMFAVLGIGSGLSLAILVIEVAYHWCQVNRTLLWNPPTKTKDAPIKNDFQVALRQACVIYGPASIKKGKAFDKELKQLVEQFSAAQ